MTLRSPIRSPLSAAVRSAFDPVRRGGPELLATPSGYDWTPPVSVYKQGATYSTDYDAADWMIASTATLWVATTGNDTTGTGTEAAPYKTIKKALQAAALLADTNVTVNVQAGEYRYNEHFSGTSCDRNLNVIAVGGRVTCTNKFPLTSWTADNGSGSGTYRATRSGITDVLDKRYLDTMPDGAQIPSRLTKTASLATCQSTAGTWYTDNVSVWVHLSDERIPDAGTTGDVYCIFGTTASIFTHPRSYYLRGFDVLGVSGAGFKAQPSAGVTIPQVVYDDCSVAYQLSNTARGFDLLGTAICIRNNCRAYRTEGDGMGDTRVGVGSPSTNAVEIGCRSYFNGNSTTAAGIINGSTNHAEGRTLRVNGTYSDTYGPVIADITNTHNWMLGCEVGNCVLGTDNAQDAVVQAGASAGEAVRTWLDGCTLGTAHYTLYAGPSAQIRYRNMTVTGLTSGDVGTY